MESRRLLRALRGGQSVSIVGPRRIGKSSLLFHVQDPQVRIQHKLTDEHLIIYVDCEGSEDATRSDLFHQWSEEILWQMSRKGEEERAPLELRRPVEFTDFGKTVDEATSQGFRLIFLLDEFETMAANRNLDAEFFAQLRKLANSKNVAYVTVTQTELYPLTCSSETVLSSPFFNIFSAMHLGLFQEHEALQFVTELSRAGGLEFSDKTENFILRTAGHHPFFLHVACELAFDYQVTKPEIEEGDYRWLADKMRQELESHFHYYWDHLDAEERQLLTVLTGSREHSQQEYPLLRALERKCLVTRYNDGYDYVAASFGDFVREQAGGDGFSVSETDLTGRKLGKYYIEEKIGQGGVATVYKAYQESLDRHVAIKVLHSHLVDYEDFIGRFKREATAVARLRHPNIVQVYDFDFEGDLYYMVMEFIGGPTLKAELEERGANGEIFALGETARIFSALTSAIEYAHLQNMIHRDLKPANIMFTVEGQVVLTDFGIARILGSHHYTMTGTISGTPAYISPEQGRGERVDGRSDIYSLGVVLYEMVTGRVPFDAETPVAIVIKHINEPLPPPTMVNPEVSEAVERVILKATSKSPGDRYQSAKDMNEALQSAIHAIRPETGEGGDP